MRTKVRATRRVQIAALAAALVLVASSCWWPQTGAGPDRRAHNPHETALTIDDVGSMGVTWSVSLTDGASPPAVAGDDVYVTSGFHVLALDRSTGASKWTRSIDPQFPADLRGLGAPAVRTDTGVVSVLSHRYLGRGRSEDRFLDLDGATGATVRSWSASPTGSSWVGDNTAQRGADLAGSGSFVVGSGGDTVRELSVVDRDSDERWGGVAGRTGMPTLGTTRLYLTSGSTVAAYDVTTPCPPIPHVPSAFGCIPAWSVTLDGATQPVVIGEDPAVLYVATVTGTVHALDAATGATRWTTSVGSSVAHPPALADGVLYVPTGDGSIVAVDAEGCAASPCPISWRTPASSPISAQPAVAGGVVYAGSVDGVVRAYPAAGCGATTCAPVWTSTPWGHTGEVRGLAIASGALFVGRADGLSRYS